MKEDCVRNANSLMLVLPALFLICQGCSSTQESASSMPRETPAPQLAQTQHARPGAVFVPSANAAIIPFYAPPGQIDLCGEQVPLGESDLAERFDREFTLVVYNHAQVYLWLKRMERYFPWVEEKLQSYGLPEDLKYVAIVESDLLPDACSPKGAAGPWQFMPATGQSYGLDQRGSCDLRYDFEESTDAAFRLLRDLYGRYRNWALAIAAYNCGDKRIQDSMRSQEVRDYYHLKLPLETERYVLRILAVKAVLGNPEAYGYYLPNGSGYQELRLDRVTLNLDHSISIQSAANAAGTTYREIKRLNPALRGDDIPAGSYEIKLPAGTGNRFKASLPNL